ncbi:hypothetical protein Asi03nite_69140 [Actinoplanes siamensis]|uniref:Uncharacterized protein n=1 Tax=Actinoplanes siamensis TaxID=1223317 RepID=A0A919NEF8_9ACTN|nr:hypothetical protein Asi03nite_69140 [Actinoplanes siamensis]
MITAGTSSDAWAAVTASTANGCRPVSSGLSAFADQAAPATNMPTILPYGIEAVTARSPDIGAFRHPHHPIGGPSVQASAAGSESRRTPAGSRHSRKGSLTVSGVTGRSAGCLIFAPPGCCDERGTGSTLRRLRDP